ncbi:MAG: SH3 domain-containing protein [Pseudomonadota bacterium]
MRLIPLLTACALLAFGLAGLPGGPAQAATATVATANLNLRAGPSTTYPVVTVIPAHAAVKTYGCVADYSWCDVGYATYRGWVSASYLTTVYQGATVVVTPVVATAVGVGVVTYSRAYWDRYYVGYPWYGRWASYPAYRAPVAYSGTVVGPRGGTATRTTGCVGVHCGTRGTATGAAGGTASGARGCGPRGCGAAGTVTGAGGRTVSGARGCGPRGCGAAVVGPRGNAAVRRRPR